MPVCSSSGGRPVGLFLLAFCREQAWSVSMWGVQSEEREEEFEGTKCECRDKEEQEEEEGSSTIPLLMH